MFYSGLGFRYFHALSLGWLRPKHNRSGKFTVS
jgi:hypothetical protein